MWRERHGGIVWSQNRSTASRGPEHSSSCYAFGPTVSTTAADPTTVVLRCRSRNECKGMSVGVALGHTSPCIVPERINYQISASAVHRYTPTVAHLRLKPAAEPCRVATVKLHLSHRHLRVEGASNVIDVDGLIPPQVRPYALIFNRHDSCEIVAIERPFSAKKRFYLAVLARRFRVPDDVCRLIAAEI